MHTGPVVVGFDGSPASERALNEAAALLAPRKALVVVVWEAGRAFEMAEVSARNLAYEMPPAVLDVRTATELDLAMAETAQQLAQHGATLARDAGLDAEGLAVADDLTVADTLMRLAEERDAAAIVVGSHGHRGLRKLLLSSTSEAVLRRSSCPVVVVRAD